MDDVVILGAARTPQGRFRGALAALSAVELGTVAVRAALERSGVSPDDVDAVLLGQVLQAGAGQGPARQTAIAAGIGWRAHAATINKLCLSGLTSVIDAARLIRAGEADVVVAGGQESMTNAPHLLTGARAGWGYGDIPALDSLSHDGLLDAFDHEPMGASTERHVARLGLTRAAQDEFAAASHRRAADAAAAGLFGAELAPVTVSTRRGPDVVVDGDEGIRRDSSADALAALRPAFAAEGTLTAGNSSPISDGAAALVLARRAWAERRGLAHLALVEEAGQVAGPDNALPAQPARALDAALRRAGRDVAELDFVEINEAFAAVALESMGLLGVPHERVNIHGGAIALGHPIGASGARLVVHAAHELARRGAGRAGVALCGGGGQGDALILAR